MTVQRYCSQCYWSTNDPDKFPPRWYCLVNGRKPIVRDEDVCADWLDLRTELAR